LSLRIKPGGQQQHGLPIEFTNEKNIDVPFIYWIVVSIGGPSFNI
jgi:hypothetical protein